MYCDIPDNTIGTLAHYILDIVLLAHVEGYLAGARGVGRLCSRHDGVLAVGLKCFAFLRKARASCSRVDRKLVAFDGADQLLWVAE